MLCRREIYVRKPRQPIPKMALADDYTNYTRIRVHIKPESIRTIDTNGQMKNDNEACYEDA
jgi:hypothetical protein